MRFAGASALVFAVVTSITPVSAPAEELPDGQMITPTAAPGSTFRSLNPGLADFPAFLAGQAVTTAMSPDGKTLLVLTSGYNRNFDAKGKLVADASNEYVFVFDISQGDPTQKQVIPVPNTFSGMAFSPDGRQFSVTGGKDDSVHTYALTDGRWAESGKPITLGHDSGNALVSGTVAPVAAGLAVTADGKTIVVADYENDGVSLVDTRTGAKRAELDLRPGKHDRRQSGVAGGEFPYWITIRGNETAYVASVRDREIVAVSLGDSPTITKRISLSGQPTRLLLDAAQTRLYVACDNSDEIVVIDIGTGRILQRVKTAPPGTLVKVLPGASPNSLAFSPDGKTLYVMSVRLGGEPAAVVRFPIHHPDYASRQSAGAPTHAAADG